MPQKENRLSPVSLIWWARWDLNPHGFPLDPKSSAFAPLLRHLETSFVCTKSYTQSSHVSRQFILKIKSRKIYQFVKKYCRNRTPHPATHIVVPMVAPSGFGPLVPSPVAPADALHPPISRPVHPPQNSPPRTPRTRHLSTHRRPPATTRAPSSRPKRL